MWEEGTELQEKKIYKRFLYLKSVKLLVFNIQFLMLHLYWSLTLTTPLKNNNEFLDTIFVIVSVKNTIYFIILRKRSFIYESPFFKRFFCHWYLLAKFYALMFHITCILYMISTSKNCESINDSVYVIEDWYYISGNIEAEIENLKINFILEKLPKDSSKFPLIANKCKYEQYSWIFFYLIYLFFYMHVISI